jgi:hypothetical protein
MDFSNKASGSLYFSSPFLNGAMVISMWNAPAAEHVIRLM